MKKDIPEQKMMETRNWKLETKKWKAETRKQKTHGFLLSKNKAMALILREEGTDWRAAQAHHGRGECGAPMVSAPLNPRVSV